MSDQPLITSGQMEVVDDFTEFGVRAFTTTRLFGSVSSVSDEPVREVMGRWDALRATLKSADIHRLATASQVHGARVIDHQPGWLGWLRGTEADGHTAASRDIGLAVTVADCVPIFIAHPSGAIGILHSGWRGTAARIIDAGIASFTSRGISVRELRVHLGPAICGDCYEVSAEVAQRLTGESASGPRTVDLRAIIADHARAAGIRQIAVSSNCTRCDNDRFYSHRAGDAGRQLSVIYSGS